MTTQYRLATPDDAAAPVRIRVRRGYREAVKKLRLALLGAVVAALVATSSAAAFTPTNAYYAKQWYLGQDNAFDAWATPPTFAPGEGRDHRLGRRLLAARLHGQIAAEKSFVGGSPCIDTEGHGTIVAGEIAGALNPAGVVGLAYSSQLLVAKVVDSDGTIPLKAEAAGIRWAVNQGARVVNLSFGAVRDPRAPNLDSYSKVEAQAVAYAVKKGAVVVAAVGNADEAYTTPWPYASWPSALPHVIGVGASDPLGQRSRLLGPGSDLRRPRRARGRDLLHLPEGPDDAAAGLRGPGLHRLREPATTAIPRAPRSRRRRCRPPRPCSSASTRRSRTARSRGSSSGTPTTSTPRTAAPSVPAGRDKYSGWGRLDVTKAVNFLDSGTRFRRPTASSRTTAPRRRTSCGGAGRTSPRPSTTGTTRSTSTA